MKRGSREKCVVARTRGEARASDAGRTQGPAGGNREEATLGGGVRAARARGL
jgi:hypothetical protein